MRSIGIGILGLGTVGAGVHRILCEDRDALENRLAARLDVRKIVVRDLKSPRLVDVDRGLLTRDFADVLADPEIRVVVELIGGLEPARAWVMQALQSGRHVVTANKALLAVHGEALFAEAARRRLNIFFEGSVAGGIPVLRSIREGLAGDRIQSVVGIVNGTSNYILDRMTREGSSYEEALAAAGAAGYAEADPTLDVSGRDAAHKLALLCLLSFGVRLPPERIPTEGITDIRAFDIKQAERHGFVVRSLAIASRAPDGGVRARVHPTFVPREHILAGVHDAYNAVMVDSEALGRTLYYGRGAGMMPTAAAVVSDIIEVARDLVAFSDGAPPAEAFRRTVASDPAPLDELECESYLCFQVTNVPGVLGRVASTLGAHGVGIDRMHQDTPSRGEPMQMVVYTERTRERDVVAALVDLAASGELHEAPKRIRVFSGQI